MDDVLHSIHQSGASAVEHGQASAECREGVDGSRVLQLREAVGGGGVRHDLHPDSQAGQLLWLQAVGGERHGVPRGAAQPSAPALWALLRLQTTMARLPSLGAQGDALLASRTAQRRTRRLLRTQVAGRRALHLRLLRRPRSQVRTHKSFFFSFSLSCSIILILFNIRLH